MKTAHLWSQLLLVLLAGMWSDVAQAGEILSNGDGSITWKAGIDGPQVEFGPDGTWKRIYAQHSHPVGIPDRQGISKAYIIAEEKAKATIVRYLGQEVKSGRIVTEVNNDLNKTTQTTSGDEGGVIEKTKQRVILENLTELTGSVASGRLPGVIILERGYDKSQEEVWVKVGVSRKSQATADDMNDSFNNRSPAPRGDGNSSPGGKADDRIYQPGSEIQRLETDDW